MSKSKKIGFLSDLHIGLNQDNSMWHDIVLNFGKWASDFYLKKGINDIFILGDIFHNRSEISVSTLTIAKKFFDFFKDFNVYILAGNHDSFHKDHSKINSISIFDGWNNIKIVDDALLNIEVLSKKICLVPWGTKTENIPQCDILLGHFEIVSFYMNNYKACDHGMSSSELLRKAPIVVSGHFHKKDHRKYDNGEIIYLGSPYQQNFGDCLDERGIYVYDISENTFEFIKNEISPEHVKISLKNLISGKLDIKYLKTNIPNNLVSFVVDNKINDEKLILLESKLKNLNPLFYRLEYLDTDNKNIDSSLKEGELQEIDILKDVETYVNSLDIDKKTEVFSYIKDIYNNLIT
jgi:DNA repair exonuclease SbcCD nuclease subunit